MKFGCCVNIDKYDDLVLLGYDFIELSGSEVYDMSEVEFDKARNVIKDGRVKCNGLNAFLRPDIKIVGEVDRPRVDEYVEKVIIRAGSLGAKTIAIGSPLSRIIPTGFPKAKAIEQITEFTEHVCQIGEPLGIRILVEPLAGEFTNTINHISDALAVLNRIKSKNAGLLVDYYHFALENEELETLDRKVGETLWHVHIGEPVGRTYLVPDQIPSYSRFVRQLKTIGYDRSISIEASFDDEKFQEVAALSLKILKKIDCLEVPIHRARGMA